MSEAKDKARAAMEALNLTVKAEFVPFSQSRNKAEKSPSLNWRITLLRNGREVLSTDYSAGCGHCPAYNNLKFGAAKSVFRAEALALECEQGKTAKEFPPGHISNFGGAAILPGSLDVLHSLVSESDVLNYSTFEEWAENFGYDTDSRKAETIYRACLEIALKLRNAIGEAGLETLTTAFQDY